MALLILLSFHLILEVQLQNVPQPELVASTTVISQRGSVELDCKALHSKVSECFFYPDGDKTNLKLSSSCWLSLTGSELIKWTGRRYSSPEMVNIICFYTVSEFTNGMTSPHSLPAPVIVLDAPQLSVLPSGRSSIQLNCTPPYAGVSQCYLYPEGHEKKVEYPSCQLSLTRSELITWAERIYSSLKPVGVICFYTVKISNRWFTSPRSLPAPVKILDNKPIVRVDYADQHHEFTLLCEISLHESLAADVRCNFYIGDEKLMWMISQRTRFGSLACNFSAHENYLFSRAQSAKSREVRCEFSLNSDQTVRSPLSDKYIPSEMRPLPTTVQPIQLQSTTELHVLLTTVQSVQPNTDAACTVSTFRSKTTTASLTTYSKHDDHFQKVTSRTLLIIVLSSTCISVLLAGVMIVCLCRFICKQRTERLFKIQSRSGNQEDMITMVSAQGNCAPNYSVINSASIPSERSAPSLDIQVHSVGKQDGEYHMYCSIADITES